MQSSGRIVRYTQEELKAKISKGEDQTDYAYLDSLTEEELAASIDYEEEGFGSGPLLRGFPQVKREVTVRIDDDLIAWFDDPDNGPGPRINAVLRGYVEAQRWEEWTMGQADNTRTRKGEAA